MGTNYYIQTSEAKACPQCGYVTEGTRIHIGKSSAGWEFSFHATPALRSWKSWKQYLLEHQRNNEIVNEYGMVFTIGEFANIVEKRWHQSDLRNATKESRDSEGQNKPGYFLDNQGHSFSEGEFS